MKLNIVNSDNNKSAEPKHLISICPTSDKYGMDFRDPGRDELAYQLSCEFFGTDVVTSITSRYHRGTPFK